MGLVTLLVVLTTSPDIQISFMNNGHVAEVKYILLFTVQVYLYSSVLHNQNQSHLSIKLEFIDFMGQFSKLPYLGMKLGKYPESQIFVCFALRSAVFEIFRILGFPSTPMLKYQSAAKF